MTMLNLVRIKSAAGIYKGKFIFFYSLDLGLIFAVSSVKIWNFCVFALKMSTEGSVESSDLFESLQKLKSSSPVQKV